MSPDNLHIAVAESKHYVVNPALYYCVEHRLHVRGGERLVMPSTSGVAV